MFSMRTTCWTIDIICRLWLGLILWLLPTYIFLIGETFLEMAWNVQRWPEMAGSSQLRWPEWWNLRGELRARVYLRSSIRHGHPATIARDEIWDKYVRCDYREIGVASRSKSTHLVGMIHSWNAVAPAHNGEGGWKSEHRLLLYLEVDE